MKSFVKAIVLVAIVAAVAWLVWQKNQEKPIPVTLVSVEPGAVESTVANTRAGTVEACRRAHLSPSLGGTIQSLPFTEGSRVKKDEILLVLWSEDLQSEVLLAAQQLVASQSEELTVCEQADEAARQARRINQLAKTSAVSDAEADQARAEASIAKLRCETAGNQVTVARARLEHVQKTIEKTILRAPFDGIVAKINGELNEYVTPSPPGIQTPPVIDLIEPGCFLMSAPIDEVDAPKIRLGLPARITLDAFRGREFAATVNRIGDYVVDYEKQARTVEVELAFSNEKDLADLRVGYSADVDIILESKEDVMRIPSEALVDSDHVLRYDPQTQRLEKAKIDKGIGNWSFIEVLGGLEAGDRIVTSLGTEGVEAGALAEPDVSP